MSKKNRPTRRRRARTSWDPLAYWYDGWVGRDGSHYHQKLAIPSVMELLQLKSGDSVLDLGAGQGVLCPHVVDKGATYTGVDLSPKLVNLARKHHAGKGRFLVGDATLLSSMGEIKPGTFDAVVFLLSLQDMDPLEAAIKSAAWSLREAGQIVALLTHPCFRIPRQSGWGWDENRKLQYRRVDRYLSPLEVPLKPHPGQTGGVSRSFHRPLERYVNTLAENDLLIEQFHEIPTYKKVRNDPRSKAINRANEEIPLFLGMRARKVTR